MAAAAAAAVPPPAYDPVNPEFDGQTVMHWNFEHQFGITRAICSALHDGQMDTYEQLGRLSKGDVEELFENMRRPGGPAGNTGREPTQAYGSRSWQAR